MRLSKSDYIMGLNCIKALWLKKNRKDLEQEYDQRTLANFELGENIHNLAYSLFDGGVMVEAEHFEVDKGALLTKDLSKTYNILYEATAKLNNGCFCRIDVLERNGNAWDLIEIKSATSVKDYYIDDLSFQKYVFENAGYEIKKCKVCHIDSSYVRMGELDIMQMFKIEDVTELVAEKGTNINERIAEVLKLQAQKDEIAENIGAKCFECPFCNYCLKELPLYSIFDLFRAQKADKIYLKNNSFLVEDVKIEDLTTDNQLIERDAYLNKSVYVDDKKINEWLDGLCYPLYYLDYETVQSAVPIFDLSSPYSKIPFQFSLHIQEKPNGEVKHIEFLHKEKTDPRRMLAEFLVENLGDSGSVVVYNKAFEKTINLQLADLFSDLSQDLHKINERMVDLLEPFKQKALYSYKQNGSSSIKYVLPAFCDLSYSDMEIANGGEAMDEYLLFLEGKKTIEEEEKMFSALLKYCKQDTLAMVMLVEVLYKYAGKEKAKIIPSSFVMKSFRKFEDKYKKALEALKKA